MIKSVWEKVVDAATITSSTTSSSFKLRVADTYSILFDFGAGTGTSPTLDTTLQFSPDEGTTWYNAPIRSAQITTSAVKEMITFKPSLEAEAAWDNALAATGGALAKNFVPSYTCRFNYTAGGTSPSFAVTIYIGYSVRSNKN